MTYTIKLDQIKEVILKSHFNNEGDAYEREYWSLFNKKFSNCEFFWRSFVIPSTKRIETEVKDPNERIRYRENISPDIMSLASFHYSMFLNLVYAHNHLRNFGLSSFEDFYVHLGSACDLAESFLCKSYSIILDCSGIKSPSLKEINKSDFLIWAGKWYDDNYFRAHKAFVDRQKPLVINLLNKNCIIDEYFRANTAWEDYKRFTQLIREYRNVIVHDAQIGKLITLDNLQLVPKKEKIQKYKTWSNIFAALKDLEQLKTDFIEMKTQMASDIESVKMILNELWKKPISDLMKLLFEERNKALLQKYNIELKDD